MAKIVRRSNQGGRIQRRVRVLLGLSLSCGVALSLGAFGLVGTSSASVPQTVHTTTVPTATGNSGAAIALGIHTYVISARKPTYTDTGLDIPAGLSVNLSVAGNATCHAGGNPTGPSDCPIGNPNGVYICAKNPYFPGDGPGPAGASIKYDSLAAKIGKNGQPFVVGTSKTLTHPTGGELYLVFNDCSGGTGSPGYVDNAGSYTVTVTVGVQLSAAPVTVDTYLEKSGQVAAFKLTLSRAASAPVTVDYTTQDGTGNDAAKADEGDYKATSGTLTFPAGTTTETVKVQCYADITLRKDSAFDLELSNLAGATFTTPPTATAGVRANDTTAPTTLKVKGTIAPDLKVGTITAIKLLNNQSKLQLASVRYESTKESLLHVGDSVYVGDSLVINKADRAQMMLGALVKFTDSSHSLGVSLRQSYYLATAGETRSVLRMLKQEFTVWRYVDHHTVDLLQITTDGGVMGPEG